MFGRSGSTSITDLVSKSNPRKTRDACYINKQIILTSVFPDDEFEIKGIMTPLNNISYRVINLQNIFNPYEIIPIEYLNDILLPRIHSEIVVGHAIILCSGPIPTDPLMNRSLFVVLAYLLKYSNDNLQSVFSTVCAERYTIPVSEYLQVLSPSPYILTKVRLFGTPSFDIDRGCDPFCTITHISTSGCSTSCSLNGTELVFEAATVNSSVTRRNDFMVGGGTDVIKHYRPGTPVITLIPPKCDNFIIYKDSRITFYDYDLFSSDEYMFHLSINSDMISKFAIRREVQINYDCEVKDVELKSIFGQQLYDEDYLRNSTKYLMYFDSKNLEYACYDEHSKMFPQNFAIELEFKPCFGIDSKFFETMVIKNTSDENIKLLPPLTMFNYKITPREKNDA